MESDIKECPDKICRTCLCKATNMRSLTSKLEGEHRTLLEVLVFVANLDVKTGGRLPTQVCGNCELMMCKFDTFKRQCMQSETILNLHLINEIPDQFELEIASKPIVKDEVVIKKSKTNKCSSKKRSLAAEKSSTRLGGSTEPCTQKTDLLFDLLESKPFKDEKYSSTNPLNSELENKLDVLLDIKDDMEVKMESLNDENHLAMDFDDAEPFEPNPADFKLEEPSLSEVRVCSCSCGTEFNNTEQYKAHLETKICNGYTKSLKIKMKKKNPNGGRTIIIKRQIICPECNLEFDSVTACKRHRQKHQNIGDERGVFECTKCMRKFSRKSSYTTHINHHNVKASVKYTCDACKREFQHKAHLDNHILAVHSRETGHMCEICNTNFSTLESLETHKDSHQAEKKHRCKLCGKSFYMLSTLNDHLRTHTGEKPFLCSICGRGFSQKTNLAQHMRRHQGLKPFKCEECERRFVSKGELVAHNRKHSGAHPFVCDDCGSGFTTSSSLVKHRRIHTGERPYQCDLCPLRFAASGTLKNHRRTHTGEKPFQCSYCEKAFVQRHDLVSHIRCHTGERPFTCECGQAFRKAAALRHHARAHGDRALAHLPLVGDQ